MRVNAQRIAGENDKIGIFSRLQRTDSFISPDLVQLTASRILFQNAYYETAIKQYEKIPKTSEYWAQAQEEIAWLAFAIEMVTRKSLVVLSFHPVPKALGTLGIDEDQKVLVM